MKRWIIAALAGCSALAVQADNLTVTLKEATAQGTGDTLGTVKIETNEHGLVFHPDLKGLKPGLHGFHIHAEGSCQPAEKDGKMTPAAAAGGHWDPQNSGRHGAPWGDGHLGDLPALTVTADGTASHPVLAPRLDDLEALRGHALMVHEGGDNYADQPAPLGGGGARVACGVME